MVSLDLLSLIKDRISAIFFEMAFKAYASPFWVEKRMEFPKPLSADIIKQTVDKYGFKLVDQFSSQNRYYLVYEVRINEKRITLEVEIHQNRLYVVAKSSSVL